MSAISDNATWRWAFRHYACVDAMVSTSKTCFQFKRFAKEIFDLDKAEDGIQALKAWFDKIGTPTQP